MRTFFQALGYIFIIGFVLMGCVAMWMDKPRWRNYETPGSTYSCYGTDSDSLGGIGGYDIARDCVIVETND